MKKMTPAMDRKIRCEEKASRHINILGHYDDETLLDKSGKLIQIIKLEGINFVTQDPEVLSNFKNNRNNLLKSFSSEYALYFWEVRGQSQRYPQGSFLEGFAKTVNERYKNKIESSNLFGTELYLAIMTKHPEGVMNVGFNFIKHCNHRFDKASKQDYIQKRYKELNEVTGKVLSSLSDYKPKILTAYEKNGFRFSEPLEFLSQLLNFEKSTIPLEINNAGASLVKKRHFFNRRAGTLEMRAADGKKKFVAMLSIKDYAPVTYAGMLDELSLLKLEYVITQSFRFYDRAVTKTKIRDQQKEMRQSKDESVSQTEQIEEVFDEAASGEVGYGSHHFTLACYADSQEELNKNIATLVARFSDLDITCVREDLASECAFWAQLPGNFGFVLRACDISTKNMAAFTSLHNLSQGKMHSNHWGEAVTVFETVSGSPYFFNFHYKDVGNFLIFGAMGSGKTVLVGFLILQSMKFGGKRIIFDKDRGLEILVRAMDGIYEMIKPGIPTGFNPCQLEDSAENRKFLSSLFKKMLSKESETLSAHDSLTIDHAIEGLYRLDKQERQLCHIASFFGTKKPDSLRARFDQWHSEGSHAWLFDNPLDNLNLNPDVVGFDLGHILADAECKTPALMYLTYRVEKALEGHRGILFCDEGWLMLNDLYFRELIDNWSRTPRKKNNLFGLATQVATDTAFSQVSKAINESSYCKVFFPNSSADKTLYVEGFGLTDHEYTLIKTMPDDQHFFLLVYGRASNKESMVLRLNLQGLEEIIAVISGREETLKMLDEIRAEVGESSAVWLPLFYQRLFGKAA